MVMKTSEDNGKTWSKPEVLRDDGINVCGNPAPVIDKTGNIYLLSTWNPSDHEADIISGKSSDTRRVFVMVSEDDGRNWSQAKEITSSVKCKNWTWYATGPCHGIQVMKGKYRGRMIIPCDHMEAETEKYFSHIIFSDDHGRTWQMGGTTTQDQVNECTVAEISGGRLLLNMRNYDRTKKSRMITLSNDGGVSWNDICPDPVLVEPICQASLLTLPSGERSREYCFSQIRQMRKTGST